MIGHISIDIETYSDVDITKAGLYKYVQSPSFRILLFAFSVEGGGVQLYDFSGLAQAEILVLLHQTELLPVLLDASVHKHAFNATFEWYCLSNLLCLSDAETLAWLPQWRCTQLHGLYCGYPASLGAVASALQLPQAQQKIREGSALIKQFCTPGGRPKKWGDAWRPERYHELEPERWALFGEYCKQDVVTEMAVDDALTAWPVPPALQAQWELDVQINARGVAADMELVEAAIYCGDTARTEAMREAEALTGLANPNSRAQLLRWLQEETGDEIADLRKATVEELLDKGIGSADAQRMLELRQQLGKTSTAKYNAIQAAVCDDGRLRGLLQFYGAARTGRWAGRLIQPQNLPRTYLPALDLARDLVKGHKLDALRLCYGSVPDTLSQLIRTALIAASGHVLIDVDFASIEARIIAWLAGESWALEVFRGSGRIYEATAAQMFGVPVDRIVKGNPEYDLRQRGKVATLALGYQGGVGSLKAMGALRMGLNEDELPDIVGRWRSANPRIVESWAKLEGAALEVVQTGRPVQLQYLRLAAECDARTGKSFLTMQLPSGRKLFYAQPFVKPNDWGKPAVHYYGLEGSKWAPVGLYGGLLTENACQATARDCLADAITRLSAAGHRIMFSVHDEIVVETPAETADLNAVVRIASEPVAWAPGLPMAADGWVGRYYRKD